MNALGSGSRKVEMLTQCLSDGGACLILHCVCVQFAAAVIDKYQGLAHAVPRTCDTVKAIEIGPEYRL